MKKDSAQLNLINKTKTKQKNTQRLLPVLRKIPREENNLPKEKEKTKGKEESLFKPLIEYNFSFVRGRF